MKYFEKVPKDLKSIDIISEILNSAIVNGRKGRTVRFFKYDPNIVKFGMVPKMWLFKNITWTKFIVSDDYQELKETIIKKSWLD